MCCTQYMYSSSYGVVGLVCCSQPGLEGAILLQVVQGCSSNETQHRQWGFWDNNFQLPADSVLVSQPLQDHRVMQTASKAPLSTTPHRTVPARIRGKLCVAHRPCILLLSCCPWARSWPHPGTCGYHHIQTHQSHGSRDHRVTLYLPHGVSMQGVQVLIGSTGKLSKFLIV